MSSSRGAHQSCTVSRPPTPNPHAGPALDLGRQKDHTDPSGQMLPKVSFGLEKLGSKDSRGGPSLSDFQPARVQFLASVKPAPQVQERKAGQTDRQTARIYPSLPKLLCLSQAHRCCGRLLSKSFRRDRPHRVVSALKLGTLGMSPQAFTPHTSRQGRKDKHVI